MERLICLAIGYVCGLFQTGYIVGEMSHVDIRKKGAVMQELRTHSGCWGGKQDS